MYIQSSSPEPYEVEDYDLTFVNGLFMTVTVDAKAGDAVDYDTSPLTTIFHLSEKPSPTNAKLTVPAENITIFMNHVLSVQRRTRIVVQPAPEVKDEFQRTLHSLIKTVQ